MVDASGTMWNLMVIANRAFDVNNTELAHALIFIAFQPTSPVTDSFGVRHRMVLI